MDRKARVGDTIRFGDDVILFKKLVSEIHIRRYEQVEFVKIVESIYEEIFEALQPR
jgi:hypothetical protein